MASVRHEGVVPFDFHGLVIRELSPAGLSSMSIAEIEVAPGVRHPKARSSRCEKLYTCVEGRVRFEVAGEPIELQRGDVLHIGIGEWFPYANEGADPARLLLVHCPPFDLACEEILPDT